jgi:NADPH:quinone reductase-like Zn-dependent oxidoreductase
MVAVGPGVEHLRPGDHVMVPFGTYAWTERVLVPAAGPLPGH